MSYQGFNEDLYSFTELRSRPSLSPGLRASLEQLRVRLQLASSGGDLTPRQSRAFSEMQNPANAGVLFDPTSDSFGIPTGNSEYSRVMNESAVSGPAPEFNVPDDQTAQAGFYGSPPENYPAPQMSQDLATAQQQMTDPNVMAGIANQQAGTAGEQFGLPPDAQSLYDRINSAYPGGQLGGASVPPDEEATGDFTDGLSSVPPLGQAGASSAGPGELQQPTTDDLLNEDWFGDQGDSTPRPGETPDQAVARSGGNQTIQALRGRLAGGDNSARPLLISALADQRRMQGPSSFEQARAATSANFNQMAAANQASAGLGGYPGAGMGYGGATSGFGQSPFVPTGGSGGGGGYNIGGGSLGGAVGGGVPSGGQQNTLQDPSFGEQQTIGGAAPPSIGSVAGPQVGQIGQPVAPQQPQGGAPQGVPQAGPQPVEFGDPVQFGGGTTPPVPPQGETGLGGLSGTGLPVPSGGSEPSREDIAQAAANEASSQLGLPPEFSSSDNPGNQLLQFQDNYGSINRANIGASGAVGAVQQATQGGSAPPSSGDAIADELLQGLGAENQAARTANENRYQSILGGRNQLSQYAQSELQGLGDTSRFNINRRYDQQQANQLQDLTRRGLGNTTILSSVRRGVEEDRGRALTSLDEDLARERLATNVPLSQSTLDFMERRTDAQPDAMGYAQILQSLGSSGYGTSGNNIGLPSGAGGPPGAAGATGAPPVGGVSQGGSSGGPVSGGAPAPGGLPVSQGGGQVAGGAPAQQQAAGQPGYVPPTGQAYIPQVGTVGRPLGQGTSQSGVGGAVQPQGDPGGGYLGPPSQVPRPDGTGQPDPRGGGGPVQAPSGGDWNPVMADSRPAGISESDWSSMQGVRAGGRPEPTAPRMLGGPVQGVPDRPSGRTPEQVQSMVSGQSQSSMLGYDPNRTTGRTSTPPSSYTNAIPSTPRGFEGPGTPRLQGAGAVPPGQSVTSYGGGGGHSIDPQFQAGGAVPPGQSQFQVASPGAQAGGYGQSPGQSDIVPLSQWQGQFAGSPSGGAPSPYSGSQSYGQNLAYGGVQNQQYSNGGVDPTPQRQLNMPANNPPQPVAPGQSSFQVAGGAPAQQPFKPEPPGMLGGPVQAPGMPSQGPLGGPITAGPAMGQLPMGGAPSMGPGGNPITAGPARPGMLGGPTQAPGFSAGLPTQGNPNPWGGGQGQAQDFVNSYMGNNPQGGFPMGSIASGGGMLGAPSTRPPVQSARPKPYMASRNTLGRF